MVVPQPPSQRQEYLELIHLRAACLSNLAEIVGLLGYSLGGHLEDVTDVVTGVLTLETGAGEEAILVRRGAIFVVRTVGGPS
jgi:ABC-type tungstate transport system substrate-binding protein